MRRRELIALMGASVAWPFAALAQEWGRTDPSGLLASDSARCKHSLLRRTATPRFSSKAKTLRSNFAHTRNTSIRSAKCSQAS